MFHIKSVNNKKNLTEERKIMRNCASKILIPTFINPPQNEAWANSGAITVFTFLKMLLMKKIFLYEGQDLSLPSKMVCKHFHSKFQPSMV